MTNSTTTDKEQKSKTTAAATGSAKAETSVPTKKTAPKSPPKSPVKSKVRPAATEAKATAKPAGAAATEEQAAKTDKITKPKKAKLIRDGFTMPESEYDLLDAVKKRCLTNGLAVKKSEVLRAAIISFAAQSDAAITTAMQALSAIKTGRPPKGHK